MDRYYSFLRVIVRFGFKLLTEWEVVSLENVPLDGPFISVSNHTYSLDPLLIMGSLPRRICPLVASRWRTTDDDPDWDPRYDLDGDGIITVVDIMKEAAN